VVSLSLLLRLEELISISFENSLCGNTSMTKGIGMDAVLTPSFIFSCSVLWLSAYILACIANNAKPVRIATLFVAGFTIFLYLMFL
jgi:hypothetical protein